MNTVRICWMRRLARRAATAGSTPRTGVLTGLLAVSGGNPLAWILPALLAQGPIALAKARLHRSAALHVA